MVADDRRFFSDLAHRQAPEYLWIGCSDSRVPANQIVGLRPDEHDPRIARRREPSSSDTTMLSHRPRRTTSHAIRDGICRVSHHSAAGGTRVAEPRRPRRSTVVGIRARHLRRYRRSGLTG